LNVINKIKIPLILVGVLAITGIVMFSAEFISVEAIRDFADISPWLTGLGLVLIYGLKAFAMAFPTGLLYIAAGMVFSPIIGLIITYIGLALAMFLGYMLGRKLGHDRVFALISKRRKVADFLDSKESNLSLLCFIARVFPMPFSMVSLFFGAMKMPFCKYMILSLLGSSPFMIPFVVAGSYISNPLSPAFLIALGISIFVSLAIFVSYKTRIVTRARVTVFLVLAQIALISVAVDRLYNFVPAFAIISYAISIIMVLVLVKRDKATGYKIIWIIIIMGLPALGGILYLIFGNSRPTRHVKAHVDEHALIAKILDKDDIPPHAAAGRMSSTLKYIRQTSSYHPYINTETTYYPMGEDMFADMLADLQKAERFIFLEYFIISKSHMWEQILSILEQKAAQGVEVRLIFDDIGSLRLFTWKYVDFLEKKGIRVIRFNPIVPLIYPFMNNRNHRKIMVIDGYIGYNGGMNIADEYINKIERFGIWKDTGVRLMGDAVWSFTLMFIETWDAFCKKADRINDYETYKSDKRPDGQNGLVVPFGDSPLDNEQLAENVIIDILGQAQNYVYIFTPYLIISEKMIHALQMAAKRDVDVRIITPGIPDKKLVYRLTRSYYRYLLQSGVRIIEYTPGFLHAKGLISDDNVAIVGTINLDYRSLYLHFECATLLYNCDTIKKIKEDFEQTITQCREIPPDYRQSFFNELFDAVLHLFAPLM